MQKRYYFNNLHFIDFVDIGCTSVSCPSCVCKYFIIRQSLNLLFQKEVEKSK